MGALARMAAALLDTRRQAGAWGAGPLVVWSRNKARGRQGRGTVARASGLGATAAALLKAGARHHAAWRPAADPLCPLHPLPPHGSTTVPLACLVFNHMPC